jgi:hypothetical protein
MALRLLGKIEKHAEEFFAPAAWMLERRFPESFSRPEIQLSEARNYTTVNSLAITISPADAQALADRVAPVQKTVSALFDAFQQRQAGGQLPAQPLPAPEAPGIYGAIHPNEGA